MDGDILAFTVSARCEQKFEWGDGITTRQANLEEGKSEAKRWVSELKKTLNADKAIVALSDPRRRYFRHEVYPLYKAHRTHGQTPLTLFDLKDFFRGVEDFHPYERPDLEADDILGILATHPTLIPGEKVIVTADKDLYQIAGLHFNPRKPDQGVFTQTPEAADHFFYKQALSGDPTDGVPGCPRIGPVKAERILSDAYTQYRECPEQFASLETCVWENIVLVYGTKGKDEAYALSQARCIRILRSCDYDFHNKRPILWSPSGKL